ncbi:hypothetical protein GCM10027161_00400 [Microbispora hainanensis]
MSSAGGQKRVATASAAAAAGVSGNASGNVSGNGAGMAPDWQSAKTGREQPHGHFPYVSGQPGPEWLL